MIHREYSIDFLKFFAAILITNSHLDIFEPSYSMSVGGTFGDVLFFFCSGYTLFLGRMGRFDNWFKRRLKRLFPPVLCWGIISAFLFAVRRPIDNIIVEGGGWFVQCIFLYYLLAYPIRKYAIKYITAIFFAVFAFSFAWYYYAADGEGFSMYGWNYVKWLFFFLFFLQGAMVGYSQSEKKMSFALSLIGLIVCTMFWYITYVLPLKYNYPPICQFVSLIPLIGFSFFFYKWCKSDAMDRIFHNKYLNPVIRSIGGLCFEIYLVQSLLFYSYKNIISYPVNMLFIWIAVLLWAYILHIFSNFFVQTIADGDYDWKKILKIY